MSEEKKDMSQVSDGYHTFGELYDHRCLLWIALVLKEYDRPERSPESIVYWLMNHYPGWDLLVWETSVGQLSYHVPEKFRKAYADILPIRGEAGHKYDGHTPNDVLDRLKKLVGLT